MNNLFFDVGEYPEFNYSEVYSTNQACYFDEWSIYFKCTRNSIKVYNLKDIVNINPYARDFFSNIAYWEHTGLKFINCHAIEKEILYIHICKRSMKLKCESNRNNMIIAPGMVIYGIENNSALNKYFDLKSGGRFYKYGWLFKRLISRLRNESIFQIIKMRKRLKLIVQNYEAILVYQQFTIRSN